jgi:hypothetical protein
MSERLRASSLFRVSMELIASAIGFRELRPVGFKNLSWLYRHL